MILFSKTAFNQECDVINWKCDYDMMESDTIVLKLTADIKEGWKMFSLINSDNGVYKTHITFDSLLNVKLLNTKGLEKANQTNKEKTEIYDHVEFKYFMSKEYSNYQSFFKIRINYFICYLDKGCQMCSKSFNIYL